MKKTKRKERVKITKRRKTGTNGNIEIDEMKNESKGKIEKEEKNGMKKRKEKNRERKS
jgi:hypothetical protein